MLDLHARRRTSVAVYAVAYHLAGQEVDRCICLHPLRVPAPFLVDPPVPDDVTRCRWRTWLARDLGVLEVLGGR